MPCWTRVWSPWLSCAASQSWWVRPLWSRFQGGWRSSLSLQQERRGSEDRKQTVKQLPLISLEQMDEKYCAQYIVLAILATKLSTTQTRNLGTNRKKFCSNNQFFTPNGPKTLCFILSANYLQLKQETLARIVTNFAATTNPFYYIPVVGEPSRCWPGSCICSCSLRGPWGPVGLQTAWCTWCPLSPKLISAWIRSRDRGQRWCWTCCWSSWCLYSGLKWERNCNENLEGFNKTSFIINH